MYRTKLSVISSITFEARKLDHMKSFEETSKVNRLFQSLRTMHYSPYQIMDL